MNTEQVPTPDQGAAAPAMPPERPPEPPTLTAAAALAAQAAAQRQKVPAGLEATLEKVATELLNQQRSDRRWRNFFRVSWLLLAATLLWATLSRSHVPAAGGLPICV